MQKHSFQTFVLILSATSWQANLKKKKGEEKWYLQIIAQAWNN